MKYSGSRTIYSCKEQGTVDVPIGSLLDERGNFDLYTELEGKAYFDISYRQGTLALRARGFVGLIPLSDRIAIHVEPKAPIGNLMYMVWRSGTRLTSLEGFVRGYLEQPNEVKNPEELYVATFLTALKGIRQAGILKEYVANDLGVAKRGRLLIGPTVSRFHSRGVRHQHVFRSHDLTVDNAVNRILKFTLTRLARHFIRDPVGPNRQVATQLQSLLELFRGVDCGNTDAGTIARETIPLIRALPNSHRFYEHALWLSYLIATHSGVVMEQIGRAHFDSVVIDVADVFERYVRILCQEAASSHFGGCQVLDGNRNALKLFVTGGPCIAQPDYYFRRGQTHVAVADAKYKPKITAEDRHALLAFCEVLGVTNAAFICPLIDGKALNEHQGTTRGGIDIHTVRIDLNAADLRNEEHRFKASLAAALRLTS